MRELGEGLWVKHFPFRVLGAELGKTVTVLRVGSGELLVHSGAPLQDGDRAEIAALGRVSWVMEATRLHDTFARDLRRAFPGAEFLVPVGFPLAAEDLAPCRRLGPAPAAWRDDLVVEPVRGVPVTQELAVFHRASRTLVLADLVFNLQLEPGRRMPFFLRWVSGIRQCPATSRLLRLSVRDRVALRKSVERILAWDFERVVVGHGAVIEHEARATLAAALEWTKVGPAG